MKGIVIPQQGLQVFKHQSGASVRRRGKRGARLESEGKHRDGEQTKVPPTVNTEDDEEPS